MAIPVPSATLHGRIVDLRAWRPDDAEWYVGARDEEIFGWTREPRALDPAVLKQVIEANRREPKWVGCAIADPASGTLLGNIALKIEGRAGEVEVSYWVAAEARGRGVASDAVRTLVQWAFEVTSIERVDLFVAPGNTASQRVAVHAGFQPTGELGGSLRFCLLRPA